MELDSVYLNPQEEVTYTSIAQRQVPFNAEARQWDRTDIWRDRVEHVTENL